MVYKAAVRFGEIVSLDVIFTYRWGLDDDAHAASRQKDEFHFTFTVPTPLMLPQSPPL